ncbi:uncharacterized protein TNCV_1970191 [Trichonephila clavipes]|nr:uncharacterized protein TNCV_1970191 [Trichonephila clavipes]
MLLISAFLLAFAFTSAYREDQNDSDKYIDEVLSVHLPKHVKNADLDVYEMPDFYFNVQDFSIDNVENVVDLRYRGRYDVSTGSSSSCRDHVQQRNFFGDISLRNVEAQIEVKTSEDGDQYSVTNLLLLSKGEYRRGFQYNNVRENHLFNNLFVPFEEISEPFYRRSFYVFQHIFYGAFRSALKRAVNNVSYPREHY